MPKVYSETEIIDWLAANLSAWQYADDHLTRTYSTGNWQLTLLLANAIGYLAEAGWHHPELILTYPRLTVRLQTDDAGGITDKDLELDESSLSEMWGLIHSHAAFRFRVNPKRDARLMTLSIDLPDSNTLSGPISPA